jgi:hypothetical protein
MDTPTDDRVAYDLAADRYALFSHTDLESKMLTPNSSLSQSSSADQPAPTPMLPVDEPAEPKIAPRAISSNNQIVTMGDFAAPVSY